MEEAEKNKSKVVYLGHEFDNKTWQRLYHENRYTLFKFVKNRLFHLTAHYVYELMEFRTQLHTYGPKKFVESSGDQYTINW